MKNRLDRNFPERVKSLSLTPGARLIVMSDMHRGDGTGSDDFAHREWGTLLPSDLMSYPRVVGRKVAWL